MKTGNTGCTAIPANCSRIKQIAAALLVFFTTSCASIRESPKYQFVDDIYSAHLENYPNRRVFIRLREDSIQVFPLRGKRGNQIDSANFLVIAIPPELPVETLTRGAFSKRSFDVDLLTTPIKFRPATPAVPAQLNAYVNGSVFVGYRIDYFRLSYKPTPLGSVRRRIGHYGLSFGVFSGFGAAGINPTTTDGGTEQEYDGIVWQNGVAAILGVDTFTFGLGIGLDKLVDRNRNIWIYQNRPWVGLTLGLNLN